MTGALDRFFADAQLIIKSPGCTDAILSDLGLLGNEQTGPDFSTLAPDFTAEPTATGVHLAWGWGGNGKYLDQIELQVDRGTGWELLVIDTTPGYTDTAPQPATPAKWKYRGIYRVGEQRVGQWSAEQSINVGG